MKLRSGGPRFWMLASIALVGLLSLLAVLQYRWIGQLSQAERERMHTNLAAATAQFGREFDHEMARVWLAFQIDPATLSSRDWSKYAQRYDYWLRTAPYPNLVRNVSLVEFEESGDLRFSILDPEADYFAPADWPPHYSELQMRLEMMRQGGFPEGGQGPRLFGWTVAEEIPALVIPFVRFLPRGQGPRPPFPGARERGGRWPPLVGCSIVELNLEFLQQSFLPELARKHFSTRGDSAYQVAVVSRNDPNKVIFRSEPDLPADLFSAADATAGMLGVRPEDFFRPALERPGPDSGRPRGEGLRFPGRTGGFGFSGNRPAESGRWQLLVKHRAGSLDTAVAQARNRNLAISFGVLLLLGTSVAMIVVSTRRAERLARMQMEFVAGVSHELRTPLSVIHAAADNLEDGVVAAGEKVQQYGSLIRTEAGRLTGMVDQILEFATAQSNRRKYDRRPVDVATVIENALATSAPTLAEAGVAVARQVHPGLPAVMADRASLENCIQNLLSNAVKYGKDGGQIAVRAETAPGENGDEVRISVHDHGPGIDPQDLPHIFEPFYRGARAVADQIHGTGLGLSLVKRIMEAQGGRVTVKSLPGKGAAFTLHLPAAANHEPAVP